MLRRRDVPCVPETIVHGYLSSIKLCSMGWGGVEDEARVIGNILIARSFMFGKPFSKRMVVSSIAGGINNPSVKPCIAIFHPLPS